MPILLDPCFSTADPSAESVRHLIRHSRLLRGKSSGFFFTVFVTVFLTVGSLTVVGTGVNAALASPANSAPLYLPNSAAGVPPRLQLVPPVPGGIVDNWRPPSSPYGPGNRGVDLRATVGEPVVSVGSGVVTFAGQVGGRLFVVIDVAGVKITLGFLRSILVKTGQSVRARELVAYANGPVHVGARQGTTYIDPRPLFSTKSIRLTR